MESVVASLKDRIASTDSPCTLALKMNQKHWCLKQSTVFGHLPDEELTELESRCEVREFARRDVIYSPVEAADCAYIVDRGRVRIYHITGDGKQVILSLMGAGDSFGDLSAFRGTIREEYAEATEKCVLVQVPRIVFLQTMDRIPSVSQKLNKLFAARLLLMERRLKSLLFGSSRQRLWDLLQELAAQYATPTAAGLVIAQKLSHQDLASLIGATRETVTITLGELQAEGLIEINNRQITLRETQTGSDDARRENQ